MSSINVLIQPERPTITTLVTNLRDSIYFVDPTFQRRLVWTERQKVRLIETILIGFPMPEIYLWQQPADIESGQQRRSIVDGQQRITTMLQFVSNEWSLRPSYLTDEYRNADFADLFWKDLGPELKKKFWDYVVNTRIIPSEVNKETIVAVFTRLNETDRSLNPQEIRNAEFNGEFIKVAEEISELDFWSKYKIFTPSQVRRMADIEFASGLLIYLRKGSTEENQKTVNEVYDTYNDVYEDGPADLATVKDFLAFVDAEVMQGPAPDQFFAKPVHLFTLFVVDQMMIAQNRPLRGRAPLLKEFAEKYTAGPSDDPLLEKYRKGAASRTRSKANRDARSDAMMRWLATRMSSGGKTS